MTFVCTNTTALAILIGSGWLAACGGSPGKDAGSTDGDTTDEGAFSLEEASVAQIRRAFERGSLTSHDLVASYLDRIARFDAGDSGLHAVLAVNAGALAHAAELDEHYLQTGTFVGPLHGIPVLLKDNLDTVDQPTSAGCLALAESQPPDDAFVVGRLRAAGAIVLGKTNMMELGVLATMSLSSLGGMTSNAYDPTRSSLGSSGGSAVAVAANLSAIALGTDTESSIVAPSAANGVVGLRPTVGLVSRDGIVAGLDAATVVGPITRTVEDAARLLEVMVGPDPSDPSTLTAPAGTGNYLASLQLDGLVGARLGTVPELIDSSVLGEDVTPTTDAALALMQATQADLRDAGASLFDVSISPIIAEVMPLLARRREDLPFKFWLNRYLETLGPTAPMHSLGEIVASERMLPELLPLARAADEVTTPPESSPAQLDAARGRRLLRQRLIERLDAEGLDALVYLTLAAPAAPLDQASDDPYGSAGGLSALSGLPSISVPIGFTPEGLPLGMTLLARPFDEAALLGAAFAYEQRTRHRRAPVLGP